MSINITSIVGKCELYNKVNTDHIFYEAIIYNTENINVFATSYCNKQYLQKHSRYYNVLLSAYFVINTVGNV